jgi:hypothetical protein
MIKKHVKMKIVSEEQYLKLQDLLFDNEIHRARTCSSFFTIIHKLMVAIATPCHSHHLFIRTHSFLLYLFYMWQTSKIPAPFSQFCLTFQRKMSIL